MSLATLTLIVEIVFYLTLCAGVVAQLKGLYKWHDRLQAPVVILNLLFIIFVMIPTFRIVATDLPSGLSNVPTLVTTMHAVLGTIAQGLAIYMFLAGFKFVPRKIGVLRYWMWATFVFWTLTVLFGIGVYILYYTGGDSAAQEAVAEHNADLVEEHAAEGVTDDAAPPAADSEEAAEEIVAEHAAEEIVEEAPEEPADGIADEVVDEHAEAGVVEEVIEPTAAPTATPVPTPTPTPAPVQVGRLTITDAEIHGDQVTITLSGVTPPAEGTLYEAWLGTPEEAPFSLGLLTVEGDSIRYSFVDPEGRNLLGLYSDMFITEEPVGDADPAPSETIAFSGSVPPAVIDGVRLAVVSDPDTPDGDGPLFNARAEANAIELETGFQATYSIPEDDLPALKIQAEGVLNIIDGEGGPNFGDSDNSGDLYSPGDGYGLLPYLEKGLAQIEAVGQAEGATPDVLARVEEARTATENVISLVERLREIELQLLEVESTAAATELVTEANDIGIALLDVDEAGFSDPTQAGATAAYTYAQLVATIDIFTEPEPVIEEEAAPDLIDEGAVDEHGEDVAPDLIDESAGEGMSEHAGE